MGFESRPESSECWSMTDREEKAVPDDRMRHAASGTFFFLFWDSKGTDRYLMGSSCRKLNS